MSQMTEQHCQKIGKSSFRTRGRGCLMMLQSKFMAFDVCLFSNNIRISKLSLYKFEQIQVKLLMSKNCTGHKGTNRS